MGSCIQPSAWPSACSVQERLTTVAIPHTWYASRPTLLKYVQLSLEIIIGGAVHQKRVDTSNLDEGDRFIGLLL